MKIAEFFATLGFKSDTKDLETFDGGIKTLQRNLIGLKELIMGGVIYGTGKFIESSTKAGNSLLNFNLQTGESIRKLQEWRSVAQLANPLISEEEVDASIASLSKYLANLKVKGGDISAFSMLGIDPLGKDAFQVFEELRQRSKVVPRADFSNRLAEMGISQNLVNAFQLDDETFRQLKLKFIRTEETEMANVKASIAVKNFKLELDFTKDILVGHFAPAIEKSAMALSNFVVDLREIIAGDGKLKKESEATIGGQDAAKEKYSDFRVTDRTRGMGTEFPRWLSRLTTGNDRLANANLFEIQQFERLKAILLNDEENKIVKTPYNSLLEDSLIYDTKALKEVIGKLNENLSPQNLNADKFGTSFNNNYYIQSTANPEEIAEIITKTQEEQFQRTINSATVDYNNNGF